MEDSPIKRFFRGRSVFITGGTGFMGKVLVEKLLRTCTELDRIYLLIRPTENMGVSDRINKLFASQLFSRLAKENPTVFNKVKGISGDIRLPDLGLDRDDQQTLVEDVSVTFHVAATVRFDEMLRDAVELNVMGTQRVVDLCRKMKRLTALVHVSTAYSFCDKTHIDEVVYENTMDPQTLLKAVASLRDEEIRSMTELLITPKPNTYIFTKALSEILLAQESDRLPIAIIRPSIVISTWKEPFPGWIDNINGPAGLAIAYGKGYVRTLLADPNKVVDLTPVDIAINLMIATAWKLGTDSPKEPLILNCTSGTQNPITWGAYNRLGEKYVKKYPIYSAVWYPAIGLLEPHRWIYEILDFCLHYLPALFIDLWLWIRGNKMKMLRMYQRLSRTADLLAYFTTHEWHYKNNNVLKLWKELSSSDQALFPFDISQVHWTAFLYQYFDGIRKHLLHEDFEVVPLARKKLKKFYMFSNMLILFSCFFVFFIAQYAVYCID